MRALHVFPLLAFVAGFGLASTAIAQPKDRQATAQDFVAAGERALREGRPADALRAYKDAYALHPTRLYACNVGRLALRLERWTDAAEHLEVCTRNAPLPTSPDELRERAEAADELTRAKAAAGRLEIEAPAGATVFVDDREVGIAPLSKPIYVDAGTRKVIAKVGTTELRRAADVPPGNVVRVSLGLPARSPPPPPPAPPKPRSYLPSIVIGVVAGAGLVGSAISLGVAQTKWDTSDRAYSDGYLNTNDGCLRASVHPLCEIYFREGTEAASLQNASIAGFIGSGAVAALAVVLAVVPTTSGGGVRVGISGTSIEVGGAW